MPVSQRDNNKSTQVIQRKVNHKLFEQALNILDSMERQASQTLPQDKTLSHQSSEIRNALDPEKRAKYFKDNQKSADNALNALEKSGSLSS